MNYLDFEKKQVTEKDPCNFDTIIHFTLHQQHR